MEFTPHKFVCQQNYLHKLNRGIIHRAVNKIMGVEDHLHDISHKIEHIACTEPFMFCSWLDETGRKVAYGRQALPRLRKEMSHSNESIACCAIRQLTDLVHDPEIAVEALKMNIIARFVKPLQSDNVVLQERSLECIRALSNQPCGMAAINSNKYIIENISKCVLHPSSAIVRSQAAVTVNALAQNYIAVRALVEAAYVKVLMQNLIEAKDYTEENNPLGFSSLLLVKDMMVLHLDTLDKLLEDSDGPKIEAIAYDAFLLAHYLTGECTRLKKATANFFCQIAKHSIGKDGIFNQGLIIPLCKELIHNEDPDSKAKIAAVLQFATIHKEARKQAFKTGLFEFIIEIVPRDKINSDLRICLLKILTNFAELPEGKQILKTLLARHVGTYLIKVDRSKTLINVLRSLVEVILWEP